MSKSCILVAPMATGLKKYLAKIVGQKRLPFQDKSPIMQSIAYLLGGMSVKIEGRDYNLGMLFDDELSKLQDKDGKDYEINSRLANAIAYAIMQSVLHNLKVQYKQTFELAEANGELFVKNTNKGIKVGEVENVCEMVTNLLKAANDNTNFSLSDHYNILNGFLYQSDGKTVTQNSNINLNDYFSVGNQIDENTDFTTVINGDIVQISRTKFGWEAIQTPNLKFGTLDIANIIADALVDPSKYTITATADGVAIGKVGENFAYDLKTGIKVTKDLSKTYKSEYTAGLLELSLKGNTIDINNGVYNLQFQQGLNDFNMQMLEWGKNADAESFKTDFPVEEGQNRFVKSISEIEDGSIVVTEFGDLQKFFSSFFGTDSRTEQQNKNLTEWAETILRLEETGGVVYASDNAGWYKLTATKNADGSYQIDGESVVSKNENSAPIIDIVNAINSRKTVSGNKRNIIIGKYKKGGSTRMLLDAVRVANTTVSQEQQYSSILASSAKIQTIDKKKTGESGIEIVAAEGDTAFSDMRLEFDPAQLRNIDNTEFLEDIIEKITEKIQYAAKFGQSVFVSKELEKFVNNVKQQMNITKMFTEKIDLASNLEYTAGEQADFLNLTQGSEVFISYGNLNKTISQDTPIYIKGKDGVRHEFSLNPTLGIRDVVFDSKLADAYLRRKNKETDWDANLKKYYESNKDSLGVSMEQYLEDMQQKMNAEYQFLDTIKYTDKDGNIKFPYTDGQNIKVLGLGYQGRAKNIAKTKKKKDGTKSSKDKKLEKILEQISKEINKPEKIHSLSNLSAINHFQKPIVIDAEYLSDKNSDTQKEIQQVKEALKQDPKKPIYLLEDSDGNMCLRKVEYDAKNDTLVYTDFIKNKENAKEAKNILKESYYYGNLHNEVLSDVLSSILNTSEGKKKAEVTVNEAQIADTLKKATNKTINYFLGFSEGRDFVASSEAEASFEESFSEKNKVEIKSTIYNRFKYFIAEAVAREQKLESPQSVTFEQMDKFLHDEKNKTKIEQAIRQTLHLPQIDSQIMMQQLNDIADFLEEAYPGENIGGKVLKTSIANAFLEDRTLLNGIRGKIVQVINMLSSNPKNAENLNKLKIMANEVFSAPFKKHINNNPSSMMWQQDLSLTYNPADPSRTKGLNPGRIYGMALDVYKHKEFLADVLVSNLRREFNLEVGKISLANNTVSMTEATQEQVDAQDNNEEESRENYQIDMQAESKWKNLRQKMKTLFFNVPMRAPGSDKILYDDMGNVKTFTAETILSQLQDDVFIGLTVPPAEMVSKYKNLQPANMVRKFLERSLDKHPHLEVLLKEMDRDSNLAGEMWVAFALEYQRYTRTKSENAGVTNISESDISTDDVLAVIQDIQSGNYKTTLRDVRVTDENYEGIAYYSRIEGDEKTPSSISFDNISEKDIIGSEEYLNWMNFVPFKKVFSNMIDNIDAAKGAIAGLKSKYNIRQDASTEDVITILSSHNEFAPLLEYISEEEALDLTRYFEDSTVVDLCTGFVGVPVSDTMAISDARKTLALNMMMLMSMSRVDSRNSILTSTTLKLTNSNKLTLSSIKGLSAYQNLEAEISKYKTASTNEEAARNSSSAAFNKLAILMGSTLARAYGFNMTAQNIIVAVGRDSLKTFASSLSVLVGAKTSGNPLVNVKYKDQDLEKAATALSHINSNSRRQYEKSVKVNGKSRYGVNLMSWSGKLVKILNNEGQFSDTEVNDMMDAEWGDSLLFAEPTMAGEGYINDRRYRNPILKLLRFQPVQEGDFNVLSKDQIEVLVDMYGIPEKIVMAKQAHFRNKLTELRQEIQKFYHLEHNSTESDQLTQQELIEVFDKNILGWREHSTNSQGWLTAGVPLPVPSDAGVLNFMTMPTVATFQIQDASGKNLDKSILVAGVEPENLLRRVSRFSQDLLLQEIDRIILDEAANLDQNNNHRQITNKSWQDLVFFKDLNNVSHVQSIKNARLKLLSFPQQRTAEEQIEYNKALSEFNDIFNSQTTRNMLEIVFLKRFITNSKFKMDLGCFDSQQLESYRKFIGDLIGQFGTDATYSSVAERYVNIQNPLVKFFEDLKESGIDNNILKEAQKQFDTMFNFEFNQAQIAQLIFTSPSQMTGVVDFYKRAKMEHSSTSSIDTQAQWEGVTVGTTEQKYVIFSDIETNTISSEVMLSNLSKSVEGTTETIPPKVNEIYNKVTVTDGQAGRTLRGIAKVMIMQHKWSKELDASYKKLRDLKKRYEQAEGKIKFTKQELMEASIVVQAMKGFTAGAQKIDVNVGKGNYKIRQTVQHKNSEMIVLDNYPFLFNNECQANEKMGKIADAMDGFSLENMDYWDSNPYETVIDVFQHQSCVKVGAMTPIDMNSNTVLNDMLSHTYSMPFSAFGEQVIVNNHGVDHIQGIGTQIMKLVLGDQVIDGQLKINGQSANVGAVIQAFQHTAAANTLEAFADMRHLFNDEAEVAKLIKSAVEINPKYGKDILKAVQLVNGNPRIAFNDPALVSILQPMVLSIVRKGRAGLFNGLSKQKINGGALVQESSVLRHDELAVVFEDSEGNEFSIHTFLEEHPDLKGKDKREAAIKAFNAEAQARMDKGVLKIKYMECYAPMYSKEFYDTCYNEETGTWDINKLPEELRYITGYRIPTEDLYSAVPLKIKGFLPIAKGSSIVIPAEVGMLSGSDFDIDKLYFMHKAFKTKYEFLKGEERKKAISDFWNSDSAESKLAQKIKDLINTAKEQNENAEKHQIAAQLKKKWEESLKIPDNIADDENINQDEAMQSAESLLKLAEEESAGSGFLSERTLALLQNELNSIYKSYLKSKAKKTIVPIEYDLQQALEDPFKLSHEQRNNFLMDVMTSILQSENAVSKILNPGDFSYLKDISSDAMVATEEDNRIGSMQSHAYYFKQNNDGASAVGVYANMLTSHAQLQQIPQAQRQISSYFTVKVGGYEFGEIDPKMQVKIDDNCKVFKVSKAIAMFLGASVDNAKDPVLAKWAQNSNTFSLTNYFLRIGMPLELIYEIMASHVIQNNMNLSSKEFWEAIEGIASEASEQDTVNKDSNEVERIIDPKALDGYTYKSMKEIRKGDNAKNKKDLNRAIARMLMGVQGSSNLLNEVTSTFRADTSSGGVGAYATDILAKIFKMKNLHKDLILEAKNTAQASNQYLLGSGIHSAAKKLSEIMNRIDTNNVLAKYTSIDGTFDYKNFYYNEVISNDNRSTIEGLAIDDTIGIVSEDSRTVDDITFNAANQFLLSIYMPKHMLSKVVPYFSGKYKELTDFIESSSVKSSFNYNAMTRDIFEAYGTYMLFRSLPMFSNMSEIQKQAMADSFAGAFPKLVQKYMADYTGDNGLLNNLRYQYSASRKCYEIGQTQFTDNLHQGDDLTLGWEALYNGSESDRIMATMLTAYELAKFGYEYDSTHKSLVHRIPAKIKEAIDYNTALQHIKTGDNMTQDMMEEFKDMFLMNNINYFPYFAEQIDLSKPQNMYKASGEGIKQVIEYTGNVTPESMSKYIYYVVETSKSKKIVPFKLSIDGSEAKYVRMQEIKNTGISPYFFTQPKVTPQQSTKEVLKKQYSLQTIIEAAKRYNLQQMLQQELNSPKDKTLETTVDSSSGETTVDVSGLTADEQTLEDKC